MLLSLCLIVKNEEKHLPKCLDSVADLVDEIIIVDTGSTDHTVEIAKIYGAKVFFYDWNDHFSDAKNFALEQATGDWIMTMDGDEELSASDKYKIPPLLDHADIDIYLFQTLSYVGSSPGLETVSNLNIRLIRNHRGYRFKGAIHEQISNMTGQSIERNKVKIEKIIIYHYGYLEAVVVEKNKPNRNMKILEQLLEKENDNNFHLFNMGNEYLRLGKYEKALEYYHKAYEKINPHLAHSPKLLFKLIMTLDLLAMYDQEMDVLNTGLMYYPKFIDLEYLRACLFHKQKKYSLAIKGFKRCLALEDSPLQLCNISGVGDYKAYYGLAEIYSKLEDYDEAYTYYIETIKAKPDYYIPLYRIAQNLLKRGRDIHVTRATLEKFFGNELNAGAYTKLGDIFFGMGKYDVALKYFLKAQEILTTNPNLYYYIGMGHIYLRNYRAAYLWLEKIESGNYVENALYKMILCQVLSNDMAQADHLLQRAKSFKNNNITIIYEAFKNIVDGKDYGVISENKEDSKEFADHIFILLNMLIKVAPPEIFEKSLQLLNLINNDEVLLRLAKLYYANGYYHLAYQEFIRSIKLFEKIDKEGLEMMKNSMDIPRPFTL